MQTLSPRALPLLFFKGFYEAWQTGKQYFLLMAGSGIVLFQNQLLLSLSVSLLAFGFSILTYMQYRNYLYDLHDDSLSLASGVFKHQRVTIKCQKIERFEKTQNVLERILGLQSLLFFTRGSSTPTITLSYLTFRQRSMVISALSISNDLNTQEAQIKSRWISGALIGDLYPYLTAGILVTTPLFLALNVLQQPPTPDPIAAKAAVTDVIDMGLLPLLTTIALAFPFYVMICLFGKIIAFGYLYSFARFATDSDSRIHGRTGIFKRRDWTIHIKDIQYVKVETFPLLESLGRFNITLMPMGKSDVTMLIPGADATTLNRILALQSIKPLIRGNLKAPSFRTSPFALAKTFFLYVLPIYWLVVYILPANSLSLINFNEHVLIVACLLFLTTICVVISHRNNRIDEGGKSIIIGARQLSRTYFCFSRVHMKSILTKKSIARVWPFICKRYSIANKTVTASYISSRDE